MTTQNPITPEAMTIRVGAEYAYRIRQTAIDGELVSFGAKGKTVRAVVIHADARFIRLSFRLNRKAMTISLNLAQFCGLLAGDEDGNRLTPVPAEPVDWNAQLDQAEHAYQDACLTLDAEVGRIAEPREAHRQMGWDRWFYDQWLIEWERLDAAYAHAFNAAQDRKAELRAERDARQDAIHAQALAGDAAERASARLVAARQNGSNPTAELIDAELAYADAFQAFNAAILAKLALG
jgi:hypothetical protein